MTNPTLGDLMPARPRRSRTPLVAALVALAVLLVAAGVALLGDDDSPAAAPAAVTSGPPATTTPPTSAAASPTPAAHRLGQKVVNQDGTAQATVLAYKQPVATGAPAPEAAGMVWGAAHIQVCARDQRIGVSRWPWKLAYADGGLIEPSNTGYDGFPVPEYPWDEHPLDPSRCAKGWVVFAVPPKQKPAFVQYLPQGSASPTEWRVP
jgi:hypothetical protein